jgi:hypothetical protein
VLGDVQVRHRRDDGPLGVVEMTEGDEMVGQGAGLVEGPGLEGGHELDLVDQAILEGEQSEEQIARGVDPRRHDRQLPSLLSLANHPGEVPHRLPKKGVAARGCHCNEVPAGLLGIPLPRRILGLGAEGTTVRHSARGRTPPALFLGRMCQV